MAESFACPHGHRWEAAADQSGKDQEALVCPVCGASGETLSASHQYGTLPLPPPPETPDGVRPSPTHPFQWRPGAQGHRLHVTGYEVLGELGRGGMGVVYKARQLNLNRVVALKMLLSDAHAGHEELTRFVREAEAVASLQHPNIVHIYDIGQHEGRAYLSLEFVGGGSLAQRLGGSPWPARQAAELVETLARAIHCAHQHGVIHRDLKPANVLMTSDGFAKISDFGLAKRLDQDGDHTPSGLILGTPCYMSPEQAGGRNKEIGPAANVYALGAILYELLTGQPPFRAGTTWETMALVVAAKPVPPAQLQPGVPAELEKICLTCLQKDPAQRYANAEALAGDLRQFLSESTVQVAKTGSVQAEGDGRKPRTQGRVRKMAGIAGLGILLVGMALWFFRPTDRPPAPPLPPPLPAPTEPYWETLRVASDEERFERIAFPTRDIGYIASRQGVYKTADGGKNWKRIRNVTGGSVRFLYFSNPQTGWLGTDQLVSTEDGGETWSRITLSNTEELLSVDSLALGRDGWMLVGATTVAGDLALFSKRDATTRWQRLALTMMDDKQVNSEPYRKWSIGGIAILAVQEAVLVLFQGDPEGGVVIRTTDGFAHWSAAFTDDNDFYRVQFVDSTRGWLAGSQGTVWATADAGVTWQPRVNPEKTVVSCMAFDPRAGIFGLAALLRGKVMMTTDGQTWHAVTEVSLGDALSSAVVVDPGCAFVLATDGRIAHYVDPRVEPAKVAPHD